MLRNFVLLAVIVVATCVPMPGGWSDAPVDDEKVVAAALHATRVLSERYNSKYHHALVKVVKAEQQVVAGINYRMNIIIGMTECKKGDMEFEEAQDCELQDSKSTYKKCTVTVFKSLKGQHRFVRAGCTLTPKDYI